MKAHKLASLIIGIALAWSLARPALAQSCSTNANTGVTVNTTTSTQQPDIKNSTWQAQTFTVTGTGCFLLNTLTINVARFNSPQDLVIEIVGTTAPNTPGRPAGLGGSAPVLASATISLTDLDTASGGTYVNETYVDVPVDFVSPPQIIGGVQYAVLVHEASGGSGNNYWQLGLSAGATPSGPSPYSGGAFCKWNAGTSSWDCPSGPNGGLDVRLSICVSPCPTGCVLTQGFWKTHGGTHPANRPQPNAWPPSAVPMLLGTQSYPQAQLLAIFNEPVVGNGLLSLAHQLIAAKLNIANGADGSTVATAIADADTLIGGLVVPPIGGGWLAPADTSALTTILDNYNNGLLGPAHCP
ncbi:MAG: hypothetical protein HY647_01035 [Acidobacteria bacterium]|nr:hypothetical protein [Acidobacteriota bacterium]